MSLFRRAKVIHEKPRPPGVTAAGAAALVLGGALLASVLPALLRERDLPSLEPLLPPLAAGLLLLLAGAGLLRRSRRALLLALGLALAGSAGSGAGLILGLPIAPLGASSAWGWLLALWYCLLAFFYLRQKRVVETF